MSEIKEAINQLENDTVFKDWRSKNKDSYLCHCFKMMDEANIDDWQIGYYNKNDTIITFMVSSSGVQKGEESEIFKKPGDNVKELNKDNIKVSYLEALDEASAFAEKNYSKEVITNKILILQNLKLGQVYNITFVTMAMNTINIKIDSSSKEVLEHKLTSLMDLSQNNPKQEE